MIKVNSNISNITYDVREMVRIVNPKQAAAFWINGAKLYDIYPSRHFETNEPMVVYLFKRSECTELYDKWCKHELK